MDDNSVYRTEGGTVFRVSSEGDGHLTVQVLRDRSWIPAPIGMAGLRVAPTTRRLTARQVEALGT